MAELRFNLSLPVSSPALLPLDQLAAILDQFASSRRVGQVSSFNWGAVRKPSSYGSATVAFNPNEWRLADQNCPHLHRVVLLVFQWVTECTHYINNSNDCKNSPYAIVSSSVVTASSVDSYEAALQSIRRSLRPIWIPSKTQCVHKITFCRIYRLRRRLFCFFVTADYSVDFNINRMIL
jgi:hypothetical protein